MLSRLGNKSKLMKYIHPYFPPHKMRIDLFFGAGGAFFGLPKPQYSILNDLDDDVTNFYFIIQERKEEFIYEFLKMPISSSLVRYWKNHQETDPLKKALRFTLLSNFTYLGKGDTLRLGLSDQKKVMIQKIDQVFLELQSAKLCNYDFREVIPKIEFADRISRKEKAFVFMDPVYLDSNHTYKVPKWKKDDTLDCLDLMITCGIRAAMCEFDHPIVIEESKKRGLNIIPIKERRNIKKRSTEILITNYNNHSLFNQNPPS